MQISNLRPTSGAGMMFDVHITPDLVLRDWTLKPTRQGIRAFPPSGRSGRAPVWVSPTTIENILRLARETMEGAVPNDHHTAA